MQLLTDQLITYNYSVSYNLIIFRMQSATMTNVLGRFVTNLLGRFVTIIMILIIISQLSYIITNKNKSLVHNYYNICLSVNKSERLIFLVDLTSFNKIAV